MQRQSLIAPPLSIKNKVSHWRTFLLIFLLSLRIFVTISIKRRYLVDSAGLLIKIINKKIKGRIFNHNLEIRLDYLLKLMVR